VSSGGPTSPGDAPNVGGPTNAVLEVIRTRRMVRALTAEPIARPELEAVLKAARWAPSAGNRRLHRFVAIQDPTTLDLLRMVSPGMFQRPTAIVVICIDRAKAESFGMRPTAKGLYVDVGTAAQTMLLAAHSLGLGAGVVTSFSQAAVSAVLNVPEGLSPEMFVCLGHPAPVQPRGMPSRGRVTWETLTQWERFPSAGGPVTG
jgi:nitroreductase